jgi:hypothetical protein
MQSKQNVPLANALEFEYNLFGKVANIKLFCKNGSASFHNAISLLNNDV